jgi:hypothetical protein
MRHRIEAILGALLALAIVAKSGTRAMLRVWLSVAFGQLRALPSLLGADLAGTAATLGLMLLRIGIALVPSLVLIHAAPWQRRIWLVAAVLFAVVFSSPVSLSSTPTLSWWLLLLVSSTVATLLQRRLSVAVILPFAVLLHSMPGHVLAARRTHEPDFRHQLFAECARRDGRRPTNFTEELVKPAHALSPAGNDRFLLTGQGEKDDVMFGAADTRPGSWWLRRENGGLVFDHPSSAEGRFWRGCLLDGALFTAQAARVIGARGDEVLRFRLPSQDIDMGDSACENHRVFIGEGTLGGLWELDPGRQQFRRHEIDRLALLPMRRFDGKIVVNSTSQLNLFDGEHVLERTASALLSVGFDLCAGDGAAAVADETGRLRIFTLDNGHYRFAWGLPLFAPRRVAWSPDCARLAVTSSDDHSVFIIDAAARRVIETHQAGPALREVTATGPREFSVTDACAVTSYPW